MLFLKKENIADGLRRCAGSSPAPSEGSPRSHRPPKNRQLYPWGLTPSQPVCSWDKQRLSVSGVAKLPPLASAMLRKHHLNAFIVEADHEGCKGSPLDVVFFKQDGEHWQTCIGGLPHNHSLGGSCSLSWTNTGLQSPNCKHEKQTAHRGIQPQADLLCPF